jgi:hypothetical protein
MHFFKSTRAFSTVALAAIVAGAFPVAAPAQVAVAIDIAPPAIPIYTQPAAPAQNDIWTPGHWAWGPAGYYWVPGTWVAAPQAGYLWTPGYWGYQNNNYVWNGGFWGPTVGYYGGVNYGFGYWGNGYYGGRWDGGVFRYNTAVSNVNRTVIRNVYVDRTVVRENFTNRISYNGGRGGLTVRETDVQRQLDVQHRMPMTAAQQAHEDAAAHDRNQAATVNHGTPPHTATQRPMPAAPKDNRNEPTADDRKAAAPHVQHPPSHTSDNSDKSHKPPTR